MRVLLDTSCLVAAVLPQHEHHAATAADLARRRAAGQAFVMAAHAVIEAYAVLTRLPPPHRLAPADALAVLDRNWGRAETVALTGAETWRVVRQHGGAGAAGGRIYDGAIAASARKAQADEILTWNLRHFDGAVGVRAVAPAA
ncbi:MAG: PIN domain-containing protein [Acidobacteria bacterium]|nr:PIN domain-containing protein [Acidobacteriota bacterium]